MSMDSEAAAAAPSALRANASAVPRAASATARRRQDVQRQVDELNDRGEGAAALELKRSNTEALLRRARLAARAAQAAEGDAEAKDAILRDLERSRAYQKAKRQRLGGDFYATPDAHRRACKLGAERSIRSRERRKAEYADLQAQAADGSDHAAQQLKVMDDQKEAQKEKQRVAARERRLKKKLEIYPNAFLSPPAGITQRTAAVGGEGS
ncbi:hypothetical protein M885DRAFT_506111 [Pelagophyceae sp. CCMP2097]|nr:hypothetical protein M885DRAFT_506111 [Pelagophyceae sp. CCMP2097]